MDGIEIAEIAAKAAAKVVEEMSKPRKGEEKTKVISSPEDEILADK